MRTVIHPLLKIVASDTFFQLYDEICERKVLPKQNIVPGSVRESVRSETIPDAI